MSIACAVLMCHAPIVIPAIAAHQAGACSATTEAMRKTARTLIAHEPSLIVLISPHAPRRPRSIGLTFEEVLSGTLQVRILVFGYYAFTFARYAKANSIISGAGLVTPTF